MQEYLTSRSRIVRGRGVAQMTQTTQTQSLTRYESLVAAARILADARFNVSKEDGTWTSPAWTMLHHALDYLTRQAEAALREDGI